MKHFYDLELLEDQIFGETAPEYDGELLEYDGELPEEVPPADLTMTLTMEDGSRVTCRAAAVFLENEKEYIALETGEGELLLMILAEGEDDSISLLPIGDDAEREAAFQAFLKITETERGENSDGDQNREED